MFLILFGLLKVRDVCYSSLVPFPCALVLESTHSYLVFMFFHLGAFSISFRHHGLQDADVE